VFLFLIVAAKKEAADGDITGAGDRRRHHQAAATVARCQGCSGTPNRDDLIHGFSVT
jgi:hypothetical protein